MKLKDIIYCRLSPKYRRQKKELKNILDFAESLIAINQYQGRKLQKNDTNAIFGLVKLICDVINSKNALSVIRNKSDNKTLILEDDILFGDTIQKIKSSGSFKVCLGKDPVISSPKDYGKMKFAFKTIGGNGTPWREDKINQAYRLILPLGITFIEEGNHSVEIGIIKCEGTLDYDINTKNYSIIDISPLYSQIYFDGMFYRDIRSKEIIEKTELEYGSLFEIGRLLSLQSSKCFIADKLPTVEQYPFKRNDSHSSSE